MLRKYTLYIQTLSENVSTILLQKCNVRQTWATCAIPIVFSDDRRSSDIINYPCLLARIRETIHIEKLHVSVDKSHYSWSMSILTSDWLATDSYVSHVWHHQCDVSYVWRHQRRSRGGSLAVTIRYDWLWEQFYSGHFWPSALSIYSIKEQSYHAK